MKRDRVERDFVRAISHSDDENKEHINNDTVIYIYWDLNSISLVFNWNELVLYQGSKLGQKTGYPVWSVIDLNRFGTQISREF